jgi:hypothetical protein
MQKGNVAENLWGEDQVPPWEKARKPVQRVPRARYHGPLFPLSNGEQSKLEKAFWKFHDKNPAVYRLLVRFARQWRQRFGPDAVMGIGQLFERVRWEVCIKTDDAMGFKLCNNHRAFYARLIMERNPDLDGVFRLRKQRLQSTIGPSNEGLPSGEHMVPADALR